jgi:hypothetical protein
MLWSIALRFILPALVLAGGTSWVVHKYNDGIREKAVAAALVKERAITAPVIKRLGEWVAERDAKLDDIKAKSETERLRLIAVTDLKTKELGNALTQNKTFKAELTRLHGDLAGFNSVLDTITANNDRATGASASTRLKQLGAAHQQCERALRESDGDLAETLGRLDEALAVVRALKP